MNQITIEPSTFTYIIPDQEYVHLADFGIEGVHQMGYALVSKVLSTYTLKKELALAQPQPQSVIHGGHPQLRLDELKSHPFSVHFSD